MANKFKGIKKAASEYNKYNYQGSRLHVIIYLNAETNEVFTREYPSCNSWDVFHDPAIVRIGFIDELLHSRRAYKLTQKILTEACELTKENAAC